MQRNNQEDHLRDPAPKDTRPEGSAILSATIIAELARAQQYAVMAAASGRYHGELQSGPSRYGNGIIGYSITLQEV